MDAYFYNEEDASLFHYPERKIYHYDFHNLLGFSMGIATKRALNNLGHKLTFILSRSSTFGSGKYVSVWSGDNYSNFINL